MPGGGRRISESTTEKTAVFAPIPRARVATAAAAKPGLRPNIRNAYRRSESSVLIRPPPESRAPASQEAGLLQLLLVSRALLAALVLDDPAVEEVDRPRGVLGEARV